MCKVLFFKKVFRDHFVFATRPEQLAFCVLKQADKLNKIFKIKYVFLMFTMFIARLEDLNFFNFCRGHWHFSVLALPEVHIAFSRSVTHCK